MYYVCTYGPDFSPHFWKRKVKVVARSPGFESPYRDLLNNLRSWKEIREISSVNFYLYPPLQKSLAYFHDVCFGTSNMRVEPLDNMDDLHFWSL
jgi:hypothetical protein